VTDLENGLEQNRPERKRRPMPARMRRGMYVLPSLFTAGNMAVGYYAITQSMQATAAEPKHFDHAALAILFAIPFDALDGRIARLTNTASEFGKELDSLADVITFGVAPSILAYCWGFRMLGPMANLEFKHKILQLGAVLCFLFLICGASRLARFNISENPLPKNPGRPGRKYFVGMPIPAAAGVLAAFVHFFNGTPVTIWWVALIWMAMVGFIGFLMVSTWRFWSGKEITLADQHPFQLVVLLAGMIALLALFSETVLLVVGLGYMVSGILARAAYSWRRRRHRTGPGRTAETRTA
jgi:CDP-diacylglycerol---serine O-phosphatidyltransferase